MVDGPDPEVDALFDLAPDEFVAARDALAKARRAARDREGAAAVKQLRRPSLSAWTLNQLARRHADDVRTLVAQGAVLAAAQDEALAGGDVDLRAAGRERTATLRRLTRLAEGILAGRGGAAHRDEVVATLTAASIEPEAGRRLLAGRLTEPLAAPSGFGGPFDLSPVGADEAVPGGGRGHRLRLVPAPAPTIGARDDDERGDGPPPPPSGRPRSREATGRAGAATSTGRAGAVAARAGAEARAADGAAARRQRAAAVVAARRAAEEVAAAEHALAAAEGRAEAAADRVAAAASELEASHAMGDEARAEVARCRTALTAAVEAAVEAAGPDGDGP